MKMFDSLESKQSSLPRHEAILVLRSLPQLVDEIELLESRKTSTLDDSSETVGCSSSFCVLLPVDEEVVQSSDEGWDLGLHPLDESGDTVGNGRLDDFRRGLESFDESVDDLGDSGIRRVEVGGESTEELRRGRKQGRRDQRRKGRVRTKRGRRTITTASEI